MPDSHATSCSVSMTNCPLCLALQFSCQMFYGSNGVMPNHSRSCPSHYFTHPFFHFRTVAVYGAFSARRLPVSKPAMFQSADGILQEFGAVRAQTCVALFLLAVQSYHLLYNPLLFLYSFHRLSHIFFPPVHKKPRRSQTLPCMCVAAKPCQRQCFLASAKLQNIIGKLHNQSKDNQPPSLFNLV